MISMALGDESNLLNDARYDCGEFEGQYYCKERLNVVDARQEQLPRIQRHFLVFVKWQIILSLFDIY